MSILLIIFILGWEDGSVGKVPVTQVWAAEFRSLALIRSQAGVLVICNPSTQEALTGSEGSSLARLAGSRRFWVLWEILPQLKKKKKPNRLWWTSDADFWPFSSCIQVHPYHTHIKVIHDDIIKKLIMLGSSYKVILIYEVDTHPIVT